MKKISSFLILFPFLLGSALFVQEPPPLNFNSGITFVENATADYDYGQITEFPETFGDGEFTFKFVFDTSQFTTIGQTVTCPGCRENWSNENETPYSAADWWFRGNFLIDGHNNASSQYYNGTFSIQVVGSGYLRWTFGDGTAADARVGDLHAIQNTSGTNILDGNLHIGHAVRRFSGSDSILELWIDGVLQDSETSTNSQTDMAATYWDSWTGYPAAQQGWFYAVEKGIISGARNDYADFKGTIRELVYYGDDLSSLEIAADQNAVDTLHPDYLDHYAMEEGTGNPTSEVDGDTMTLGNPQSGGFWQ